MAYGRAYVCIRVGSFIEGIKSISMEKLDDREHYYYYYFFFFLRETVGRVKFSCVSCRFRARWRRSKGRKSLGVEMEQ